MTEPLHDQIPSARAIPAMRWRPNLIWLIPLTALITGAWLAAHTLLAHGPSIVITFSNAEEIEPEKTRVKYKSVTIGTVHKVSLSEDHRQVEVTVELGRAYGAFLAADTRYWVVRPRVSAGQISGLGTLFTGAYISADLGKAHEETRSFKGLDVPPIVTGDLPGRQFSLHSPDMGSVDIGTPVYFRHVQVGEVVAFTLDEDGKGVTVRAFIHAPYDRYVTDHTRFWQASGIDVTVDGGGLRVDTQSLTSIVAGGIAFESLPGETAGTRAEPGHAFDLAKNRVLAMKRPDGDAISYLMYFPQSVRGLPPGAPVDFRGVVIGEVADVGVEFDAATGSYRFPVEVNLYPERLRSHFRRQASTTPELNAVLRQMVNKGLRAQLRTDSLITGQYFVAMDYFPTEPKAQVDWQQQPVALPTVRGGFDDLLITLQSIARKLDQVPVDQLANEARTTLIALRRTLADVDHFVQTADRDLLPEAKATLGQARQSLQQAEQTLSADAPLQTDVRRTMQDLSRAAQSLRSLTEQLDRDPQALLRGRTNPPPASEIKP